MLICICPRQNTICSISKLVDSLLMIQLLQLTLDEISTLNFQSLTIIRPSVF